MKCENCGKEVKKTRGGQCALCHAAHPKEADALPEPTLPKERQNNEDENAIEPK